MILSKDSFFIILISDNNIIGTATMPIIRQGYKLNPIKLNEYKQGLKENISKSLLVIPEKTFSVLRIYVQYNLNIGTKVKGKEIEHVQLRI